MIVFAQAAAVIALTATIGPACGWVTPDVGPPACVVTRDDPARPWLGCRVSDDPPTCELYDPGPPGEGGG